MVINDLHEIKISYGKLFMDFVDINGLIASIIASYIIFSLLEWIF